MPKTKPTLHQDAMMQSGHWEDAKDYAEEFLANNRSGCQSLIEDCEERGIIAGAVVYYLMESRAEYVAKYFINAMIDSLKDPEDD